MLLKPIFVYSDPSLNSPNNIEIKACCNAKEY